MTYSLLRMTACTPGSAPGPTLGNEYGKPLPFYWYYYNYGEEANGDNKQDIATTQWRVRRVDLTHCMDSWRWCRATVRPGRPLRPRSRRWRAARTRCRRPVGWRGTPVRCRTSSRPGCRSTWPGLASRRCTAWSAFRRPSPAGSSAATRLSRWPPSPSGREACWDVLETAPATVDDVTTDVIDHPPTERNL